MRVTFLQKHTHNGHSYRRGDRAVIREGNALVKKGVAVAGYIGQLPPKQEQPTDYTKLSKAALIQVAEQMGVEVNSRMTKSQLIEALS